MEPSKSPEARSKTHNAPPGPATSIDQNAAEAEASMEKVREILFGRRIKEQETNFTNIKSKFESELKSMRSDILSRLSNLEAFFKSEVKNLTDHVRLEHEGWEKAAEKFNIDIGDLRQMAMSRIKSMSDNLHSEQERFSADVKNDRDLLDHRKMDRTEFIELLNEWALRLNNEDEVKGGRSH